MVNQVGRASALCTNTHTNTHTFYIRGSNRIGYAHG